MRRGVAVFVVGLLALVGALVPPVVGAAVPAPSESVESDVVTRADNTTTPDINASINGESVTDGQFVVLRDASSAVLRARIAAPSGRTLETVLVTVDGEIVVDIEDPGSSVTINRSLPIGAGNNTVRIVAEDSREALATRRVQLYLERVPPAMDLETPVDTTPQPFAYENVVTNRTLVTFAGQFRDLTGFAEATVSFVDPASGDVYRSFRVGSSGTFDERVHLKRGRTVVRVSTTDTLGNNRLARFNVYVRDESAPAIDLGFDRTPIESPFYNVSATVSDDVWVHNVSVDVLHVGRTPYQEYARHYTPVEPALYEFSRERLSVDARQQVRLVQGKNIVTVTGVDQQGQRAYRTFEVGYYPETQRPPTVDFLQNATRIEGNTSARVSALVTDDDRDLRRVLVEVENLDRRQITDVETFRLNNSSTFLFEDSLRITPGVTEIEITAIDARNNRTTDQLYLDTRASRRSEEPPSGYEGATNDSESGTIDPSVPDGQPTTPGEQTTEAPPTATDGTVTATTDGGNQSGESGGDGENSDGESAAGATSDATGPLSALTSLPVLAVLASALLGGGYYLWIKLTRV